MAFNTRTHGKTGTRLFRVWSGMRERCANPHHRNYKSYGGRGIKVCPEWNDYSTFEKWAIANGYDVNAPRGVYTLEREDNNGNYCPENCHFASNIEQANNKSNNRHIEYDGVSHTAAEWARITGISTYTIRARIDKLGWTVEQALTAPTRKTGGAHGKA